MTFTSVSLGEIASPINILREILHFFNRKDKCKAAILSLLDSKNFYMDWVRLTYEGVAEALGYTRITIAKHFKELIDMGLIDAQPSNYFPTDTANKYKVNAEMLQSFVSPNKQASEAQNLDVEPVSHQCKKLIMEMQEIDHLDDQNLSTYTNPIQINKSNIKLREEPPMKKPDIAPQEENQEVALEPLEGTEEEILIAEFSEESSELVKVAPISENDYRIIERVKANWQKTGVLPKNKLEMQLWASFELGQDILNSYRKSGIIFTTQPGDIDRAFAVFVARCCKKDIDFGYTYIRKMENDPTLWETLGAFVTKWKVSQGLGNRRVNIATEVSRKSPVRTINLKLGL
jgi:predicted transcriptional regulator